MIIKNIEIVNHNEIIKNGYIVIENDIIKEIGSDYQGSGIDLEGKRVLPGFIDIHIHGTKGSDAMDGTKEAIETIMKGVIQEGTTSFLATTLTMSEKKIIQVCKNVASFHELNEGSARLLGMHLEGPFINVKYKGAQNEKYVQKPNKETLDKFIEASNNRVKVMTYAPELADTEFTAYMVEKGIVPSAGHSSATMAEVLEHVKYGLKDITHFHNGQSGHHHRTPGVVSAGFACKDLNTEIIVDGNHLHRDTVKMTFDIKTKDKVLLITDGMRAKCMPDGIYDLGGLDCVKTDKEVRTSDGSLAGSILEMSDAINNMMDFSGCNLMDIATMASYNQAKLLKEDHRLGVIKEGYLADFVILDENNQLYETFVNGKSVYKK